MQLESSLFPGLSTFLAFKRLRTMAYHPRVNITGLLRLLKEEMRKLKPSPPANHLKNMPDVPRDLESYTHVLIWMNTSRSLLNPPYEGTFKVPGRGPHYFSPDVGGTHKRIFLIKILKDAAEQFAGRTKHHRRHQEQDLSTVKPYCVFGEIFEKLFTVKYYIPTKPE